MTNPFSPNAMRMAVTYTSAEDMASGAFDRLRTSLRGLFTRDQFKPYIDNLTPEEATDSRHMERVFGPAFASRFAQPAQPALVPDAVGLSIRAAVGVGVTAATGFTSVITPLTPSRDRDLRKMVNKWPEDRTHETLSSYQVPRLDDCKALIAVVGQKTLEATQSWEALLDLTGGDETVRDQIVDLVDDMSPVQKQNLFKQEPGLDQGL